MEIEKKELNINSKYLYRPKTTILDIIFYILFGIGGLYAGITNKEGFCFLKGLICISQIMSSLIIITGSLFCLYKCVKLFLTLKSSNREQFIKITNMNFVFPKNTSKPTEIVVDFRDVKEVLIYPIIGKNRKITICYKEDKIVIEEKILENEGEFEEIWKILNSLSKNKS